MDTKDKKLIRNTALIFGIIVVLLVVVIIVNKVMTANVIKEQETYERWLLNNCDCIEWERIKCPKRFEWSPERGWCVGLNTETLTLTNKRLACSQYNCSGEIKVWNNETEKWEDFE